MRHGIARGRFIGAGACALGAAAAAGSPAKAAQYELRCVSDNALDHPSSVRGRQMWAAIERESGGRVRTQFFPFSQLGNDASMLSQLRVGAVHFFIIGLGVLAPVVPVADISNLGFAFRDEHDALRVMDGPAGDYFRKEVAAKGLYALPKCWGSGMRVLSSSLRPIRTPDDMAGFKVRVVSSRIVVDMFKALGASPTPLGFAETYTALQTKVVDGNDVPLATTEQAKFYEVQKYISLTNHSWSGQAVVANGDFWSSLPPDVKEIIERNEIKYAAPERRDAELINASVADKLTRQGLTINKVDPAQFRTRLHAYYRAWAAEFGPTLWGLLESAVGQKLE